MLSFSLKLASLIISTVEMISHSAIERLNFKVNSQRHILFVILDQSGVISEKFSCQLTRKFEHKKLTNKWHDSNERMKA